MKMKTCLLTGYPGYLGSRLYDRLQDEYELYTLGLEDARTRHHLVADISQGIPRLDDVKYDLVIHAAGMAHVVPKTAAEKRLFFQVNEQGTRNLLSALDGLTDISAALVLISSVAVYGREVGDKITEQHVLNASDAYGLSKTRAEEAVIDWRQPDVVKGILRLPLVVGKNPPGTLGRMIDSIRKGAYFNIAGGKARRSLVWIDDIAPFILQLVARGGGTYNLTDGHDASFKELYESFCRVLGKSKYPSLPKSMAKPLAVMGDALEWITRKKMPFDSYLLGRMTSNLTFSCDKAILDLKWKPTKVVDRIGDLI